MNSVEIDSFRSVPEWVKGLIDGESTFGSCRFAEKIDGDSEAEAAILVSTLFDTLCSSALYEGYWFEYNWTDGGENGYVLTVYISYPGGDEPYDPGEDDPELYDKANELIKEVFGEEVFEMPDYYDDYEDYDFETGTVDEWDGAFVPADGDLG